MMKTNGMTIQHGMIMRPEWDDGIIMGASEMMTNQNGNETR